MLRGKAFAGTVGSSVWPSYVEQGGAEQCRGGLCLRVFGFSGMWSGIGWRGKIRVLGLSFVGHLGLQTVAIVHVGDDLLAAVGEVHGVAALSLVAIAALGVAKVSAGVVVGHAIVVRVLGRGLLEGDKDTL